jgi:hypothetical protein
MVYLKRSGCCGVSSWSFGHMITILLCLKWPNLFGEKAGRIVEWVVTYEVLWVAMRLGRLVGLKGTYEEYTPRVLKDMGEGRLKRQ